MVKNLVTDRVTKLHINDIKLDVTRASTLNEDEKEDDLEEGIDNQDGPMEINLKGNDKNDSQNDTQNDHSAKTCRSSAKQIWGSLV